MPRRPLRAAAALLAAAGALAAEGPQDDRARMFKVVNGECAQATIARKFQDVAAALSGLTTGSCQEQGYTEAEGRKVVSVPVLGEVAFELYKKADLLGFALDVGTEASRLALGLEGSSACCKVCQPPSVRHLSVDTAKGHCSEGCLAPGGSFWLLKALEPSLRLAGDESCAAMGYEAYNRTVTHGITPMSLSMDVYTKPPKGLVTLSKIIGGICGQATIDEKSEVQAARAAGLERGDCVARGYTEAAGSKAAEVPVVGRAQMALFRKPGELDLVDALRVSLTLVAAERVTLYKISDDVCGEATIDKKYEAPAETFAGLQEGKCKDHGYSEPAGSKELHVPVLGDIKIALYKKAGMSEVVV